MTFTDNQDFERVGKFHKGMAEACEVVQVDVSSAPRGNGRANTNGKHGKGDAYIRWHSDMHGGCVFNHQTRQCAVWRDDAGHRMSRDEYRRIRCEEALRHAEEEERERKRAIFGAETANILLSASKPIDGHEYLSLKHVRPLARMYGIDADEASDIFVGRGYRNSNGEPYRLGLHGFLLLIPMYLSGKLQTVEFIDAEGRKRFMKDAPKKGAHWLTRPYATYLTASKIGIAEGVATALSVDLVNGCPCVAAMDCGSLKAVAKHFRAINPRARIVILSDFGNGEKEAREAARACHGAVALPMFTDALRERFKAVTGKDNPTDWNDFYIATGEL